VYYFLAKESEFQMHEILIQDAVLKKRKGERERAEFL
jgi:hypothetical protein